jgi:hypothetical protein
MQQVLDGLARVLALGSRYRTQLRAQAVAIDDVFYAGGLQPSWHLGSSGLLA